MSRTGRTDYDQIVRFRSIPSDEPTFTLRAQDSVGAPAVRAYVQLAQTAGADSAFLELASAQADAMEAWPTKKLPDVDLDEPARRNLTYVWSRRQWNGGKQTAEAMAEARGHALGLAADEQARRRILDADRNGDYLLACWTGAATPDVVRWIDGEWQDERGEVFGAPDFVRACPELPF